jgi:hypothetical protein
VVFGPHTGTAGGQAKTTESLEPCLTTTPFRGVYQANTPGLAAAVTTRDAGAGCASEAGGRPRADRGQLGVERVSLGGDPAQAAVPGDRLHMRAPRRSHRAPNNPPPPEQRLQAASLPVFREGTPVPIHHLRPMCSTVTRASDNPFPGNLPLKDISTTGDLPLWFCGAGLLTNPPRPTLGPL